MVRVSYNCKSTSRATELARAFQLCKDYSELSSTTSTNSAYVVVVAADFVTITAGQLASTAGACKQNPPLMAALS